MFGKDTFWVRKDMVNDLIGYRAAGVSDAWTGITRWSPEMQRTFKEFATVFFGTKAYRYLSTAEGAVEDVMSAVKTTIIVRSIVVMRDNLTANLLQLHMNGMSLPEIGKKMISKFLEITEYVQNKSKITTLERQYTSAIAKQNQTEAKKLRAKIAALEDANASMSIAPLIKAGEFNTISESLTEADVAIRDSKFGEWLENAVDKLPSGIGGVAKNLVAEYNSWKGYTPSVRQDGATVVIEDDSKNFDMLELGYVRIGDYVGDAREAYQGKRAYYQSSVGGTEPLPPRRAPDCA